MERVLRQVWFGRISVLGAVDRIRVGTYSLYLSLRRIWLFGVVVECSISIVLPAYYDCRFLEVRINDDD